MNFPFVSQITFETLDYYVMLDNLTSGVAKFLNGVITPLMNFCANSKICLAFLACTFVTLGVKNVRRLVSAFGRGR